MEAGHLDTHAVAGKMINTSTILWFEAGYPAENVPADLTISMQMLNCMILTEDFAFLKKQLIHHLSAERIKALFTIRSVLGIVYRANHNKHKDRCFQPYCIKFLIILENFCCAS